MIEVTTIPIDRLLIPMALTSLSFGVRCIFAAFKPYQNMRLHHDDGSILPPVRLIRSSPAKYLLKLI